MPSISMFKSVKFASAGMRGTTPMQTMTVGGPLLLDDPKAYGWPIAISYAVFQSPPGKHDLDSATRVRGVAVVEKPSKTWKGSVEIKDGTFHDGEARLIAQAALPRDKDLFAYETLTWCESFTLKGTGHKAPPAPPSGR